MSRYNPNAKWSVLMNSYSKYSKDLRRLDTNYSRWQSTGFDKGLLVPGKKLYKQVKGTSGKPMVMRHRAEQSAVVCEKEFQDFMSCMIDRNYDNQQCMGQHKLYMGCVHDHKQAVRLAKREAPPTIAPRAPNGMKMSRYNMYKQQERFAKFELDADVQRVQSNMLRKRNSLIVPGHVDPKAPTLTSHGIANSKLQMNEGPNGGISSKKFKYL